MFESGFEFECAKEKMFNTKRKNNVGQELVNGNMVEFRIIAWAKIRKVKNLNN